MTKPPLACVLLGCDWGTSWMSSDGLTRRVCRRCGEWRGVYLDDPPPQDRPVYVPSNRRTDWSACQRRGLHNHCVITGSWNNHDGGWDGH